MPFQYKKVLVVGATSGIGEALASRFVQEGSTVIVTGRRKDKLEAFVHRHGRDKASAVPFDITEVDKIPHFATNIVASHSDLDCILLNSGIQKPVDFSKPDTVDLETIREEFTTNYLSYLALAKAFLPFLQGQAEKSETCLMFMSSGLAILPILRCSNYCATKAALHQWIMVLREQLRPSKIKVVEIFPPAVQTELHDEDKQPDIKNGRSMGMPLDQFINDAYAGISAGQDDVAVERAKEWYDAIEPNRRNIFCKLVDASKRTSHNDR